MHQPPGIREAVVELEGERVPPLVSVDDVETVFRPDLGPFSTVDRGVPVTHLEPSGRRVAGTAVDDRQGIVLRGLQLPLRRVSRVEVATKLYESGRALEDSRNRAASAHPMPHSAMLLDVHPDRVEAQVQLPVDDLHLASGLDVVAHPEQVVTRDDDAR